MILKNSFDNLSEADVALLDEYFDGFDYDSSGHTLLASYIWREHYRVSWEVMGEYLVIASMGAKDKTPRQYYLSFPLTRTGTYDKAKLRDTILMAKARFEELGSPLAIALIPENLIPFLEESIGDIAEIERDRDDDDYVYLREDLESLSGRKLHSKKNHLNQFLKNYDYTYEEITKDNIEEVRHYINSKNEYIMGEVPAEYREMLEFENDAIEQLLSFVGTDRILSGVIRVDGKVSAVTIGEFENTRKKDKVIVHVEKADDRIKGLYQAINNEFVKHLPKEVIYVNREEDMGLPTLRQTKEGYKPHHMSKKYNAFVK